MMLLLTTTTSRHAAVGLRLRLPSASPLHISASCHAVAPARLASRAALTASSSSSLSIRQPPFRRTYASSAGAPVAEAPSTTSGSVVATYEAPLGKTFRRLKTFSLSSLTIASLATPALLLAPGEYTLFARSSMAITALSTSGLSTALIAFLGGPYVATMRLVELPSPAAEGEEETEPRHVIELDTYSWRLQKITTTIYEPSLLRPTERPFATWEVAVAGAQIKAVLQLPRNADGQPILITQSRYAKSGEVRGSFVLSQQKEEGIAKVEAVGYPLRHFQVHEELLGEEWQVLE